MLHTAVKTLIPLSKKWMITLFQSLRQRNGKLSACLGYRVSSRPGWANQQHCVSISKSKKGPEDLVYEIHKNSIKIN